MKKSYAKIKNVKFGKNVNIIEPTNIYESVLGDDVFVGPFVEIQKDTKIGSGTRIQSHSFICELVEIGKNCFIGHGVVFINDKFNNKNGPSGDSKLWKKTKIGDNVSIGSNSTILPINICSGSLIGAGSVVTKNIKIKGVYAGNPAKLINKRFTEDQIDKLLEIQWWTWDDDNINEFTPLLCNEDINNFINLALNKL